MKPASGSLLLIASIALSTAAITWSGLGTMPLAKIAYFGHSAEPAPTGERLTVLGISFLEISPGVFRTGRPSAPVGTIIQRMASVGEAPRCDCGRPLQPNGWAVIPEGLWISHHEITNSQYERALGSSGCPKRARDREPVELKFEDARELCRRLAAVSDLPIRLPTEMEWELCARAGSSDSGSWADSTRLDSHCWYEANSEFHKHDVGSLLPNEWGLFDMQGNVAEWCEDGWREQLGLCLHFADPLRRVVRGGYWLSSSEECMVGARSFRPTPFLYEGVGVRPVFVLDFDTGTTTLVRRRR